MNPSIYGLPEYSTFNFRQGFQPTNFTSTTVDFTVGSARARNSNWVMENNGAIPGVPAVITLDTTIVGANGCYPLPLSSVKPSGNVAIFPVYSIGNSMGTTQGSTNPDQFIVPALVIATATTGFVPDGYDSYTMVGIVVVNSSGVLVPYAQTGNDNTRHIMLQDAQQTLSAGAATTATLVDLRLGSSGGYLNPDYVAEVDLQYSYTPANVANIASIIPHGLTAATTAPVRIKNSAAAAAIGMIKMPVGVDSATFLSTNVKVAAIDYSVITSDALSLWISGFTISLPFPG